MTIELRHTVRLMSHLRILLLDFVAQPYRATKSATAYVAIATNRVIPAGYSLVFVGSIANQKRKLNPRADKKKQKKYENTICCSCNMCSRIREQVACYFQQFTKTEQYLQVCKNIIIRVSRSH